MYNVFWNKIKEKYPVLLAELIQGLNQLYEQTGNELFTNKEFLALRYSSVCGNIQRSDLELTFEQYNRLNQK